MNIKQAVFLGMAGLAVVSGVYAVHRDIVGANNEPKACVLEEKVFDGDLAVTRIYRDEDGDASLENYHEHWGSNSRTARIISYDFNSGIKTYSNVEGTTESPIPEEESKKIHKRYHSAFSHKIK